MASDERRPGMLPDPAPQPGRWQFLRDVLVFQGKLVLDGARDVVLSPLSLAAALLGLITRSDAPGSYFYRVVVAGRRTESWIDLFEAADRIVPRAPESIREPGVDEVFDRLGALIAEHEREGGITATARHAIDRVLDSLPGSPPSGAPETGTRLAKDAGRNEDEPPPESAS